MILVLTPHEARVLRGLLVACAEDQKSLEDFIEQGDIKIPYQVQRAHRMDEDADWASGWILEQIKSILHKMASPGIQPPRTRKMPL